MSKHRMMNFVLSLFMVASMVLGSSSQVLASKAAAPANTESTVLAAPAKDPAAPSAPAPAAPISPTDQSKVPHYFGPYSNYANSAFTLPDVSVNISGDGSGATATATVGADGAITGVTITNPGSGYTAATVGFNSTSGSGAIADAAVSTSGVVTAVSVDQAGQDYIAPSVIITGGGATTPATAVAYGSVDSLTLTNVGTGYTLPTVDFDMPDDPNGVQAKAHVVWDPNTGDVTGIVLDNAGSGYATAPKVVIRDGTVFSPLNTRQKTRALQAQAELLDAMGQGVDSPKAPSAVDAVTDATAVATINIQSVALSTFGDGLYCRPDRADQ